MRHCFRHSAGRSATISQSISPAMSDVGHHHHTPTLPATTHNHSISNIHVRSVNAGFVGTRVLLRERIDGGHRGYEPHPTNRNEATGMKKNHNKTHENGAISSAPNLNNRVNPTTNANHNDEDKNTNSSKSPPIPANPSKGTMEVKGDPGRHDKEAVPAKSFIEAPVLPSGGFDWGRSYPEEELSVDVRYILSGKVQIVAGAVHKISDTPKTVIFTDAAGGRIVSEWRVSGGSLFVALNGTGLGLQLVEESVSKASDFFHCEAKPAGEGWIVLKVLIDVERGDAGMDPLAKKLAEMMLQSQAREQEASKATYDALIKFQAEQLSPLAKSLPASLCCCHSSIESAFRPPIQTFIRPETYLFLTKRHTNPEAIRQSGVVRIRSLLFTGASGKGKTGAATSLPDGELRKLGGRGFENAAVLGYYYKAKDDPTQKTVAENAANHFVGLYRTFCKHPGVFGKVVLHVVVDEVGDYPQLVRDLVSQAALECGEDESGGGPLVGSTFKDLIVAELNKWYNNRTQQSLGADDVRVIVSLVGTGVGRPDEQGSLPPNYLLYQPPEDLPWQLFTGAMEMACGWTHEQTANLTKEVQKDSLFAAMLTNPRCAVFSGEEAGAAVAHNELTQSIWAGPKNDVKGAAGYLCGHAEWILTRASLKYFSSNGWYTQTNKEQLISSLVSLMVTQPHGYHLPDEEVIRMLCCNVGAIEDTLEWSKDQPSVKTSAAPELDLRARAAKAGAHVCIPCEKEPTVTFRFPSTGRYRYIVPPAIAAAVLLVAVTRNFEGGMFGGARQLPSATYENVAATVIFCALDALHRHSFKKVSKRRKIQVPAVLAFPSLAVHFPLLGGGKEQMQFVMWPAGVHLMVPGANQSTNDRIDAVVNVMKGDASVGPRMVLEMAGAGSPRNDLTIHNPGGVRMGIEFKSYRDSSPVRDDVLMKRCFHMGYDTYNTTPPGDPQSPTYDKGENVRGRYITLCTDKLGPKPAFTPPPCEFLVLCGPNGGSLLQTNTYFTSRVHASWVGNASVGVEEEKAGSKDKASTCQVVCMALGIEELLFRCAEKANSNVIVPTHTPPPERCDVKNTNGMVIRLKVK